MRKPMKIRCGACGEQIGTLSEQEHIWTLPEEEQIWTLSEDEDGRPIAEAHGRRRLILKVTHGRRRLIQQRNQTARAIHQATGSDGEPNIGETPPPPVEEIELFRDSRQDPEVQVRLDLGYPVSRDRLIKGPRHRMSCTGHPPCFVSTRELLAAYDSEKTQITLVPNSGVADRKIAQRQAELAKLHLPDSTGD